MNSHGNRDPAKHRLEERLDPGADALDLFLCMCVSCWCVYVYRRAWCQGAGRQELLKTYTLASPGFYKT